MWPLFHQYLRGKHLTKDQIKSLHHSWEVWTHRKAPANFDKRSNFAKLLTLPIFRQIQGGHMHRSAGPCSPWFFLTSMLRGLRKNPPSQKKWSIVPRFDDFSNFGAYREKNCPKKLLLDTLWLFEKKCFGGTSTDPSKGGIFKEVWLFFIISGFKGLKMVQKRKVLSQITNDVSTWCLNRPKYNFFQMRGRGRLESLFHQKRVVSRFENVARVTLKSRRGA